MDDFESGASGASDTYPVQCSTLRKNGHVMLKKRPCKIVDMTTSKTGKHGHAKVHLVGLDIFTGKRYEEMCPSTHNMDVPRVVRKDYQLCDITESYMSLLDDNGIQRDDLKVPDNDVGAEIIKKFSEDESIMVTVLTAVKEEQAVATKPFNA